METRHEHVISVRGLTNRFGEQVVHDGLDLDVRRDEILAIVGGSGTGKSVLLRSILGLHRPNAGRVEVLGQQIRYLEPGPHKQWGVLFQGGALLSGLTVQENVELPIALHSDLPIGTRRELAVLKIFMVGLDLTAAAKYPSELSGGMRKRAALARALALEPEILFLDEPTSGLDPTTARAFDTLVRSLVDDLGITVFLVTHDLDTLLTVVDRVIVLARGKVLADGTPRDIAQLDDSWIRSYFAIRTMVGASPARSDGS